MANEGSVAPKERVNIVYKPATGDAQEQVELPLKQLVLGDFTLQETETPLDERKPIQVDKDNFNDVLKAQGLNLTLSVPNRLAEGESDEAIPVSLKFENLRDFEPDALVGQVPELRQLIELREALKALKGPLGNLPEFRKKLQALIQDEGARERLLGELGVQESDAESGKAKE
ncbi:MULTISPECIES: type VI secretion system contractile sheath small subunit [Achromobacter]|uniref:Type VI secretion protein n=1 Tax=Achromobacter spanius TaxID=217203 RepID=A0AAW3I730_9BURK|nr:MULTISPECIES: type VI secretion system contractile sheath small subunit [Achromobacter]AZS81955.1 type VI secretion system contractile sheath small subunit [Achromobacter spanius]KNE28691.1 type VI secretion protein [Achromobacter spanius]MCD0500134.1 type VI secretion system contractile sheath small subunit [Achromobacter sp. MY14]MCW3154024.1 type VI secretion system contractile sheath small subunit [Achromobacter spanius]WAI84589.1 type VI secretion system contractile sheath small subuni